MIGRRGHLPIAGRRVLITGGSSGIGLATAARLGRQGAQTVLVARGADALREAVAEVPGARDYVPADVADRAAIGLAIDRAAAAFGGLDAVVADAAFSAYGPFAEMEPEDYRATVETALIGTMNTAHAAIPHLARTGGTLVVVASIASRVPVPWLSAYAAAKHGVRGFARSLSGELSALGIPVRLRLVNPGPIDTRFWERVRTPDRRLPPQIAGVYSPDDVAAEIELALRGQGRFERTVGGLMGAWAFIDALAPNASLRVMSPFVKLGWWGREKRPLSHQDALAQPLRSARRSGGLVSRPSVLTRLREHAH